VRTPSPFMTIPSSAKEKGKADKEEEAEEVKAEE
jgi:hypothetical protein